MREEIRAAIAAGVPALGGRVYEEGKVLPDEIRPFAVVQKGVTDAGSPFSAHATPVDVFVEHDQTTFGAIDAILEDIVALLDRATLVEAETGKRHKILYAGSVAPDTIDEERDPGVDIRGARFSVLSLAWHSGRTFDPDPTVGLAAYVRDRFSERQVLTVTGRPTGGTYTITHPGPPAQTTAALPVNATAAQIQAALESLPNIGVGNVLVEAQGSGIAGIATTPVVFRFRGVLANKGVPQMTVQPSLTGGTTPGADLVTLANGAEVQTDPAAWNPDDDSPGVYFRLAGLTDSETHPWGSWVRGVVATGRRRSGSGAWPSCWGGRGRSCSPRFCR
jgi:hypothetical protein